jgi:hypothetical protein
MAIDLSQLFRVRLVVARFGEMDGARWWNTRGLLAEVGEKALSRGFPRTHFFAQAKVCFAVAAERCREVFDPPHAATLWNLPAEIDDQFDSEWSRWIERDSDWLAYFSNLQMINSGDLLEEARRLGLADDELIEKARLLRRSAENRAVVVPTTTDLDTRTIMLLGLGFFRGEPGSPSIPYMKLGG